MTTRLKTLLPILVLSIASMVFLYQPASAQSIISEPTESVEALEEYGIACESGECTVELSLDRVDPMAVLGAHLAINVMQDNLTFLPEGAGIQIDDNLTLKLPVGDLQLVDADVILAMDSEGNIERLRGTAEVPFPGLIGLENLDTGTPLRADLGLEGGENLAHLNAPLDDERQYLFLDFHSGITSPQIEAPDGEVLVTVPRGQDATLVFDMQEPYAYMAGNVSYSVEEQVEFVGQLLNSVDGLEAIVPDGLPIRQRVGLQMATSVGKGAEPFFQVGGAYVVDAGFIGRLTGVELTPLATEGQLTVDATGLLLDGTAASRIAPDMLFAGSTEAEVFVPFDTDLRAAYAQIDANVYVPFTGTSAEAMARVDGYDGVVAQASVTTPNAGSDEVVALETADDGRSISLVRAVADGAGDTVTRSYLFVRDYADESVDVIADGADAGRYWSQRAWCSVSGGCDQPEAVAASE